MNTTQVYKAKNKVTKDIVALKKIRVHSENFGVRLVAKPQEACVHEVPKLTDNTSLGADHESLGWGLLVAVPILLCTNVCAVHHVGEELAGAAM